jgi:hypothetical protein
MARLLLIAAVILFLLWAVRRALSSGPPPRARGKRPTARGPEIGPPDRLVCGECGAQFDAEKNGWVCPHCRK